MGGRGHSVGPLPLEGVRVLAVTQAWAGPYAGTLLADWGAEVIIVEDRSYFPIGTRGLSPQQSGIVPEADRIWSRGYPDWDSGARPWNRFAFFNSLNRNKLSATLVNTRQGGRDLFLELAAISDVVLENNPPSTMDGYGLDYDDLRRVKPDIIMARMPGYGLTGPFREFRAWGSHVEGFIGHTDLRSYPDIDPSLKDDVYPSDAVAGITAAFTVAVALRHLQATGEGQLIDSPLSEGLAPFFAEAFTDYSMNDRVRTAMANADSSMAPNNVYPCSGEDEWVSISVGSDEEWDALVVAMGSPAWARDPRYANVLGRYSLQQEIDPKIGEWTRVRTSREVMELLQGREVAAGMVHDVKQAHEDPHLAAMGFFQTVDHVDAGTHRYPGTMGRIDGSVAGYKRQSPGLGQQNEYVYRELLGLSQTRYRELEELGHVGEGYDLGDGQA